MPSTRSPIGRDGELHELAGFLAAADGRPGAMLLVGPEGMGKSTLWEVALADARDRDYLVLEARPVEAETGLSFSALSDLLAPILDSVLPALPEPQRDALEAALLLRPSSEALDPRAIGSAALSALRAAAAARRLLIAIDNIQWLDPASATTLAFALRRLRDENIGGLFAARGAVEDRIVRTWSGLMPTRVLSIGPLSLGATHALVFDRLGAVMPRPLLHRLHDLGRGNPFYTLELTRAWQAGTFHLAEAEALPPALADLLGSRIASLPARTRRVLALASQMSRPTLATLDRAVGGDSAERLDRGVAARVVEIDGDEVRFAHPLLAASAYAAIPSAERRQLHELLATVVSDGEERARHLAIATTGPDSEVAAIVERAAEEAFRRGAPSSAAALMSEAARLTPPDTVEERRRRVLAEAEYRFEAGETDRAEVLVGPLISESAPGPERARLIARQARFRHFGDDISGSVELLRTALAEAGDDPRLLIEIEEGLVWGLLLIRSDVEGAATHARSAVANAERLGDDAALAEALAALAMADALLGHDWRATMERALDLEPATLRLRVLRHPSFAYGYLLSLAD
ncbi:MAG TPA: AAA family ATPase, partial [Candidatus Limnocylindrales bacterium]|nr:AAA family ATPase [Candidatus Limnocylindrales bacterium]